MDRKIRILGIAPYEAMKTAMQKLAAQRDDLELDVYSGDLEYGAEIVRHNLNNGYDVIISRGGTAELIGRITYIPVIEISLSVYYILRSIKLAENYADRYAIVGFPSITGSAHLLCDLLQYRIDIVTIHGSEEVVGTLQRLKQNGYRMVICDMITHTTAKNLGLNAILITSGSESIESAFDQAVKVSTGYLRLQEENRFLEEVVKFHTGDTVILDASDDICFSSWDREKADELYALLRGERPQIPPTGSHKFFRNIDNTLFSVDSRIIDSMGQEYAVFYITASKIPINTGRYGISFHSLRDTQERFFNSFYSITGAMGDLQNSIDQIGQSTFPVMITGESGTGKEQIARAIYAGSIYNRNPLVSIDCGLINDRGWEYLTNHYNSPFNDDQNTIYFKNIEELPSQRSRLLLSLIIDTGLYRRNRLIFSCTGEDGHPLPEACQEFIKRLSCLTVCLPPLRERTQEIPTLSSLYLNTLNLTLGKQLTGFSPDAMDLLREYDWPQNYTQFKRVINELAAITNAPYIQKRDTETVLTKEKAIFRRSSGGYHRAPDPNINLNRPLDEITRDIINRVVAASGGNQTTAARQLGISRTTLWRYLNRS